MFHFDRKVTPGELVTVVLLLLSAGGAYASVSTRLATVEDFMKRLVNFEANMIRLEMKMDERTRAEERFEKKLSTLEERIK